MKFGELGKDIQGSASEFLTSGLRPLVVAAFGEVTPVEGGRAVEGRDGLCWACPVSGVGDGLMELPEVDIEDVPFDDAVDVAVAVDELVFRASRVSEAAAEVPEGGPEPLVDPLGTGVGPDGFDDGVGRCPFAMDQ